MKRHWTVLTAVSLVSTSAFADTVNVNVYGVADLQFESVQAKGATAGTGDKPQRFRVSTDSSQLGFKGTTDLGEGLVGIFQYENTMAPDQDPNTSNTSMWGSSRDTYVGLLIPDVGTVKLGRQSVAARWISGIADFSPGATGAQSSQSVVTQAGGFTGSNTLFNSRLQNTLGYESPIWGGFHARAYFGANENKSASGTATPLDDKTYSVGAQYKVGPLDIRATYEERNDKGTLNATTTNDTKDKDHRIGFSYALTGETTVGVLYGRMKFTDNTVTGASKNSLEKSGVILGAKHVMGKHEFYGSYGLATDIDCTNANGSACTTADSGASHITLGYDYLITKQFMIKTFYSDVRNDANAKYDFDTNGISPAAGADPRGLGAGLRYTF